jgi:hypothetical protein
MTETEQKLIDDLRPRLDNWRRAYRDRVVKNVSIAYAVERALALTRSKTDFSEDYTDDDANSGMSSCEVDMKDADLLNFVWQNFSAPGTEVLSIGTHGLNVRTAKLIVLLYVFGSQSSLSRAGKKIWNIKRRKLDRWTEDALLYFAFRVKYFEKLGQKGKEQ